MLNKLTKKIVVCPQCGKKSRVPIRPNKTLEVSCPKCRTLFRVQFKSPILEFFTWYRGKGLVYNLKSFYYRWKLIPLTTKFKIFVVGMILIYSLLGTFIMTYGGKNNQKQQEASQNTLNPMKHPSGNPKAIDPPQTRPKEEKINTPYAKEI